DDERPPAGDLRRRVGDDLPQRLQLHDALAEPEPGEDRTSPTADGPLHDVALMREQDGRQGRVIDLEAEALVERDLLANELLVGHRGAREECGGQNGCTHRNYLSGMGRAPVRYQLTGARLGHVGRLRDRPFVERAAHVSTSRIRSNGIRSVHEYGVSTVTDLPFTRTTRCQPTRVRT